MYEACVSSYPVLKVKYHSITEDDCSEAFLTLYNRSFHTRYEFDSLSAFNAAITKTVERCYIDVLRSQSHMPDVVSLDAQASDNGESFADRYKFSDDSDIPFDAIDDDSEVDDMDVPLNITTFIRFKTLHKKLQTKFLNESKSFEMCKSYRLFFSTPFSVGEAFLDHISKQGFILSDGSLYRYPSDSLKNLCIANYASLSRKGSLILTNFK